MTFDLEAAHKHCNKNRDELASSKRAGCFSCCSTFKPETVTEWVDLEEDTAICPNCEIDAVIGDASGFAPNDEFLAAMHSRWFEEVVDVDDPLYWEAFGLRPPLRVRISQLIDRIRGR